MLFLAVIFVVFPEPLLNLFNNGGHPAAYSAEIMDLGVILMRFVVLFVVFDALNLTFSGALKGAGDTRFIMWTIGALSLGIMVVPVYIAVEVVGAGIYTLWTLATIYICALGFTFMFRYRHGKWKRMRVIEMQPKPPGPGT
jgi:MATE family multidrug resistance protein